MSQLIDWDNNVVTPIIETRELSKLRRVILYVILSLLGSKKANHVIISSPVTFELFNGFVISFGIGGNSDSVISKDIVSKPLKLSSICSTISPLSTFKNKSNV